MKVDSWHPLVIKVDNDTILTVTDVYRGGNSEIYDERFPIYSILIAMRELCWINTFETGLFVVANMYEFGPKWGRTVSAG